MCEDTSEVTEATYTTSSHDLYVVRNERSNVTCCIRLKERDLFLPVYWILSRRSRGSYKYPPPATEKVVPVSSRVPDNSLVNFLSWYFDEKTLATVIIINKDDINDIDMILDLMDLLKYGKEDIKKLHKSPVRIYGDWDKEAKPFTRVVAFAMEMKFYAGAEEINSKPPERKKSLIKKVLPQLLLIDMELEIPHQDDDIVLDDEALELAQHEWLQFHPGTATSIRAHQAAVPEQEDEELSLEIEFSLCGQLMEMTIEWIAVLLCIYYELKTVTDAFTQGLTQGEDGMMRAWWSQISDTPFTSHRLRASTIRDPLIRYTHRCIVTTIIGRGQSQMTGSPCNLAWCFSLYYASFYHLQERDTLWGGAFVTHLAHSRGMFYFFEDLPAIQPRKLDCRMLLNMNLSTDIPSLGLPFIGSDGRPWQPA
ncbi:hypothetical protein R6Q57_008543 [Mikania cordata]